MSRTLRVSLRLAASMVAAPVLAQSPTPAGVVVVRVAADAVETADEASGRVTGLGFVAGDAQVIAGIDPDRTRYVVSDVGGTEYEALLLDADRAFGLGLLAVAGLAVPPYTFTRDLVEEADEVHAAAHDAASGTVALVSGRVLVVESGAGASDPGILRHDAFGGSRTNFGAPLLNRCGEIVGAVVGDPDSDGAVAGSGLAAPGAWLLARFTAAGLTATAVDAPCLSDAERAAAAEAAAAEAERRAAAETGRRRRAEAEAVVEAERREQAESAAEAARAAAEAAAEARRRAEERAAAAREQAAADRVRYVRWIAGGVVGVMMVGLVLWLAGRRSVAKARLGQVRAESLAQAAQEDLTERDGRERLASAVPAVFLDGADAAGRPIAVRVPGRTIAADGGAVVGRNPFESTVVLDHTEVSRRHFKLFTRETSVFVEDLDSTNGTTLDGVALTPGAAVPMRHGAVLQVGGVTFAVTLDAKGAGAGVA